MRKKGILITGAAGEIGDALIRSLASQDQYQIITLDVRPLPSESSHRSPSWMLDRHTVFPIET